MSVKRKVTVPVGSSGTTAHDAARAVVCLVLRLPGAACLAPMREPPGRLAERDHPDEDQPDDQHPEDDLLPLLGRALRGQRQQSEQGAHASPTLTDAAAM